MPEPVPLPSIDSPPSELDYRPLSGVAVAAIAVAGLYAIILIITAVSAIVSKRPALNTTLLYIPIVGIILAIAARTHIRRSEGTRLGMQLANAAWWISVTGGIGFGAYYAASYVALRQQSERAAGEWFDLLKKKEIDRAFFMTLPPQFRQNINPANPGELESRFGGNQLPGFRNSELARYFFRNGSDVTVESLGISNLEQIDNGYRVDLTYAVRSPEGLNEINLILTGMEGANFNGREWQVGIGEGGLLVKGLTEFGWLSLELQREAQQIAFDWLAVMQSPHAEDAVLLALPDSDRPLYLSYLLAKRLGGPMPAAMLLGQFQGGRVEGNTFDLLSKRGFFVLDKAIPETVEKRDQFRQVWALGTFVPAAPMRYLNTETSPLLSVSRERVEYMIPLEIRLPGTPIAFARGRLVLGAESPEFVAALYEAKERAIQGAPVSDVPIGNSLSTLPARHWRVLRLESNLEPLQAAARQAQE